MKVTRTVGSHVLIRENEEDISAHMGLFCVLMEMKRTCQHIWTCSVSLRASSSDNLYEHENIILSVDMATNHKVKLVWGQQIKYVESEVW